MKKKTKEFLLSSFVPSGFPQEFGLRPYQFYYDLFSDLTEGGVRSSIYQLVEKRYLSRLSLNGQSFFRITDAGIGKLTLLYPTLQLKSRKKGDMRGHLLILLKPTVHDPQFLKLRRLMNAELFTQVTRGVYYYPYSELSTRFLAEVFDHYSSAVALVKVSEFSLAFPDANKSQLSITNNLKNQISGVSREAGDLISAVSVKKTSNYRVKTMCERFFELLGEWVKNENMPFFEEKKNRELFFQAVEKWNRLIGFY